MFTMKKPVKSLKEQFKEEQEKRDQEIIRLYRMYKGDRNTGWTFEKIGRQFGLTKARVQQIWQEQTGEEE